MTSHQVDRLSPRQIVRSNAVACPNLASDAQAGRSRLSAFQHSTTNTLVRRNMTRLAVNSCQTVSALPWQNQPLPVRASSKCKGGISNLHWALWEENFRGAESQESQQSGKLDQRYSSWPAGRK